MEKLDSGLKYSYNDFLFVKMEQGITKEPYGHHSMPLSLRETISRIPDKVDLNI